MEVLYIWSQRERPRGARSKCQKVERAKWGTVTDDLGGEPGWLEAARPRGRARARETASPSPVFFAAIKVVVLVGVLPLSLRDLTGVISIAQAFTHARGM